MENTKQRRCDDETEYCSRRHDGKRQKSYRTKTGPASGWQFVDTDRRIERAVGMTIAEFYAHAGEKGFRERELNVLQQVSRYHEAVISFGGNFPMSIETYRILHRHGFIIALLSEPFRVEERVSRHIGKRPTVDYDNLREFVHKMMRQWEELSYCDCVVDRREAEHRKSLIRLSRR